MLEKSLIEHIGIILQIFAETCFFTVPSLVKDETTVGSSDDEKKTHFGVGCCGSQLGFEVYEIRGREPDYGTDLFCN